MKRKRHFKTEEQTATARLKCRDAMKRVHQSNTEEQTALARSKNRVAMKRKRQSDTEDQIESRRCQAMPEEHNDDMTNVINWSMKEAKQNLTQDTRNCKYPSQT